MTNEAIMGGRWIILVVAVGGVALLGSLAALVAQDGKVAPPPIRPPKVGRVAGAIKPGQDVRSLQLVSRQTGKAYQTGQRDPVTGKFLFNGLPGDAAYDLIVEHTDGRRIEGIDLSFVDARLLRLAAARRKQLGLPPEVNRPFSQADTDALLRFVADMTDFMDTRRVLYLQGHGKRATMLVELLRTREFVASKDDVIWRVELWYFEKHAGGWQRVRNQHRVVSRFRGPAEEWRKIAVEYRPTLSVHIDGKGRSGFVDFNVPETIDPTRGRPAGSEFVLTAKPHILGLAEP